MKHPPPDLKAAALSALATTLCPRQVLRRVVKRPDPCGVPTYGLETDHLLVVLGATAEVLDQDRVRITLATALGTVLPHHSPTRWLNIVQRLLDAAEEVEEARANFFTPPSPQEPPTPEGD